ncbi:hypothetical protein JC796_17560 [Delftia acidovorans]|uniref:hypothetical protein n=1 Tax=Delftia acidovorans TaxID=80866 RepID=UPI0018E81E75|nr:hypothetical protein [Delftia acidovorans]MBJ2142553.1 hypothetical protein [Delftia acidovorans]
MTWPTSRRFGRPAAAAPGQGREERLAQRAARALASARATAGMACSSTVAVGSVTGQAQPKAEILTCEAYRRAVASLPCISCGICGFSQHAHLNLGKGFALKTDDRTGFPLCCTRPGIEGCHAAYDQYRLVEGGREGHRAYGLEWGRITRHTIQQRGLWPARLPLWKEDQ